MIILRAQQGAAYKSVKNLCEISWIFHGEAMKNPWVFMKNPQNSNSEGGVPRDD